MNGEKMVCVSPFFSLKIETFHYRQLKPIKAADSREMIDQGTSKFSKFAVVLLFLTGFRDKSDGYVATRVYHAWSLNLAWCMPKKGHSWSNLQLQVCSFSLLLNLAKHLWPHMTHPIGIIGCNEMSVLHAILVVHVRGQVALLARKDFQATRAGIRGLIRAGSLFAFSHELFVSCAILVTHVRG